MNREKLKVAGIFLVCAVTIYLGLVTVVYRFRYPEKTETQLMLEIPDAILWR